MKRFKIVHRNYDHWDILQNDERIYTIRGSPGNYIIYNKSNDQIKEFCTVQSCIAYITNILIYELIIIKDQEHIIIHGYNI